MEDFVKLAEYFDSSTSGKTTWFDNPQILTCIQRVLASESRILISRDIIEIQDAQEIFKFCEQWNFRVERGWREDYLLHNLRETIEKTQI